MYVIQNDSGYLSVNCDKFISPRNKDEIFIAKTKMEAELILDGLSHRDIFPINIVLLENVKFISSIVHQSHSVTEVLFPDGKESLVRFMINDPDTGKDLACFHISRGKFDNRFYLSQMYNGKYPLLTLITEDIDGKRIFCKK